MQLLLFQTRLQSTSELRELLRGKGAQASSLSHATEREMDRERGQSIPLLHLGLNICLLVRISLHSSSKQLRGCYLSQEQLEHKQQ